MPANPAVHPGPTETQSWASSNAAGWAGVALFCLCAVFAAALELLFVPLRAGTVLVPIAALFAVATNIALPRLARSLIDSTLAALLPFLAWLIVVIVLGVYQRPEGDVILPGGSGVEWVAYGVLFGGAIAGTVTVVIISTTPAASRLSR